MLLHCAIINMRTLRYVFLNTNPTLKHVRIFIVAEIRINSTNTYSSTAHIYIYRTAPR